MTQLGKSLKKISKQSKHKDLSAQAERMCVAYAKMIHSAASQTGAGTALAHTEPTHHHSGPSSDPAEGRETTADAETEPHKTDHDEGEKGVDEKMDDVEERAEDEKGVDEKIDGMRTGSAETGADAELVSERKDVGDVEMGKEEEGEEVMESVETKVDANVSEPSEVNV